MILHAHGPFTTARCLLRELAHTSVGSDVSNDTGSSSSSSNSAALEVRKEVGVVRRESARATESVDDTVTAEVGLAGGAVGGRGDSEELTGDGALHRLDNILEDVALGEDVGTGADLEGVAAVVIPVVVDGVEKSVATNLGRAARGVVNVVVLEGDQVVGSVEVKSPVSVRVTTRDHMSVM